MTLNREAMDRKAIILKDISRFLNDLKEIRDRALASGEFNLSRQKVARWKVRVTEYLRQNVSNTEVDQLQRMSPVILMGDPMGSLIATVRQYAAYMSALLEEIAKHPWAVLQKSAEGETIERKQRVTAAGKHVFIVHGRDQGTKEQVARFLEKLALRPVILHEQPSQGRTIIEKFEDYSDVAYAVVLLTPDDVGKLVSEETEPLPRARQNVVFELGFFIGKLSRKRVCALYQEDIELPSDFKGVVYVPLDKGGAWKLSLVRELKAAGLEVDLDKAV